MTAALHPLRNNTHSTPHGSIYPGLDYQDIRYPSLAQAKSPQRTSAFILGSNDRSGWDDSSNVNDVSIPRRSYDPPSMRDTLQPPSAPEQRHQEYQNIASAPEVQSVASQSQQSQSQELQRSTLSYALPPDAARRVIEPYSLDESEQPTPSRSSADTKLRDNANSVVRQTPSSMTPRHPSQTPVGPGPSNTFSMPLSASPSYHPPVAPNPRAYAQQPTYITPPTTPTPIKTVYSIPPQEEICVECAMRDQDMADVDVTSPGVWDRESDVAFEELKRKELEDERNGVVPTDPPTKPRVRGGHLTEQNLKLWLCINPREPASRQQTLRTYITNQRELLEAEALAHAHAQKEARQLDSRMRDTYSQLRRSAYELGTASVDEPGGLRIKSSNTHSRSQSRDVTLLENGLIVEHVDVRKEERELKNRKRKEERRVRKTSRSSALDVTSIISANSYGPPTDGGVGGLNSFPHHSQASFSDVHSLGPASPRRTRFFGVKNLSAGWRSQDSLAPSALSGSMVDMHLALHREGHPDSYTPRRSRLWATADLDSEPVAQPLADEKSKKKKKGFAKIWDIVTGKHGGGETASRGPSRSQGQEKTVDDLPLAPPPPLSYLVNRGPGDIRAPSNRLAPPPPLQSFPLSKQIPQALPSGANALPSPASSRLSGPDGEHWDIFRMPDDGGNQYSDDTVGKSQTKSVHPVTSEPNMRRYSPKMAEHIPPVPGVPGSRPPLFTSRDKSLPPLPGEPRPRTILHTLDARPRTVYTYDPLQRPPGAGPAHDFLPPNAPFRGSDVRRQSFGGLSSRPNSVAQTMPANTKQQPGYDFGKHYNEFGASPRAFSPLDMVKHSPPSKRKSKFGLASFLGKKNNTRDPHDIDPDPSQQFSGVKQKQTSFPGDEDISFNNHDTSNSRHSAFSAGRSSTRLSTNSRKALEERVPQDSQFVAYRYPSNDQQFDLFR